MIYCVVPQALEAELFDKLTEYYRDDPNVEVIVDRRSGPDRRKQQGATGPDERREIRDRRHRRVPGTFPSTHSGDSMIGSAAACARGRARPSRSRTQGDALGGTKGEPEDAEMRRYSRVIRVRGVVESVI